MTKNEGQGFAGMDDEKQRDIAQQGGNEVSKDREHMSEIGKKGNEKLSKEDRARGGRNNQRNE